MHMAHARPNSSTQEYNLRIDIWVDADQHAHGLPGGAPRSGDVLQVELGVDVDQHAVLGRELQLPGQLAVAIEHGPVAQGSSHHHDARKLLCVLSACLHGMRPDMHVSPAWTLEVSTPEITVQC